MNEKKNNILAKSFIGIFIGNFIACLILIIFKESTYVQFWNYMGFFIFAIIDCIIFFILLGIYIIISKIFKVDLIYKIKIINFAFLFAFLYTLGDFYFVLPFMTKIGKNIKSPFIFFLTDSGIQYFFFPLFLFLSILFVYAIIQETAAKK